MRGKDWLERRLVFYNHVARRWSVHVVLRLDKVSQFCKLIPNFVFVPVPERLICCERLVIRDVLGLMALA